MRSGVGIGASVAFLGQGGTAFNPLALFAEGEAGGWYDPSDLSTMFQDVNGATPAVPGDPVGLMLDKSKGGPGPELWVGPTTDYSLGTGTSGDVDGVITIAGTDGTNRGMRGMSIGGLTVGGKVLVEFEVENFTGANVSMAVGPNPGTSGVVGLTATADGHYKAFVDIVNTPRVFNLFTSVSGATAVIKNISVREIKTLPLSQTTAAARPTYGRVPVTGRRNLLTATERMGVSPWISILGVSSVTQNAFVSSDGVVFEKIVPAATTAIHGRRQSFTSSTSGSAVTISIKVKRDEAGINLEFFGYQTGVGGSWGAIFDLDNKTVNSPTNGTGAIVGPDVDGIFHCEFTTVPLLGTANHFDVRLSTPSALRDRSFAGDGVKGLLVAHPQFEPGSVKTPYQTVTTAFDITEEGVPSCYYLRPDLTDDALTTTLPQAINGDIFIAGRNGSIIEPVSYTAGTTFSLGPDTYTGGTPSILRAIGDIVGVLLIDKTLSQVERDNLVAYYKNKGAKGLLVPGPELIPNGDFSSPTLPTDFVSSPLAELSIVEGRLTATLSGTAVGGDAAYIAIPTTAGTAYQVKVDFYKTEGGRLYMGTSIGGATYLSMSNAYVGYTSNFVATNGTAYMSFGGGPAGSIQQYDNISVRELRAEEDWT